MSRITQSTAALAAALALTCLLVLSGAGTGVVEASQGCPFDDGSCQEYCSQQGCNMGYCGHFAWIQCICRKCGDEWSWYDKVRYNPDKTVNQTELDSLKLNATSPLILTNSSTGQASPSSISTGNSTGADATGSSRTQHQQQQQPRATLTTLLIPDLSDSSKLDLNDIPDENSDKFLDYLAKNHERLVQATSSKQQAAKSQQQEDQQQEDTTNESTTSSAAGDDETVEIQITSNNNNSNSAASSQSPSSSHQQQQQQTTTPATTDSPPSTSSAASAMSSAPSSVEAPSQQQQKSPLIRLLHMAPDEQLFDTSEQ